MRVALCEVGRGDACFDVSVASLFFVLYEWRGNLCHVTCLSPSSFPLQIAALKDSIQEMGRQRARQEKVFDKERAQFKDQLGARLKEIAELKRERQSANELMQVCGVC